MFDLTTLYHYTLNHLYQKKENHWDDRASIQQAKIQSYDLYEFYHSQKKVCKITQEPYFDPNFGGRLTQNMIYLISSPEGFKAYRMVYTERGLEQAFLYQNEKTILLKELERGSITVETLQDGKTITWETYYNKGHDNGYYWIMNKVSKFIFDPSMGKALKFCKEEGLEQILLNSLEQNKTYIK